MIERYLINYDGRGEQLHPSGDFVHYADYADLERQLAEARAKEETWHKLYQQALVRENAVTFERDRLAADNARLRELQEGKAE